MRDIDEVNAAKKSKIKKKQKHKQIKENQAKNKRTSKTKEK